MAPDETPPGRFEPACWYVVFSRVPPQTWAHRLCRGRFNHVSAFGWVAAARAWVFVEQVARRGSVVVVPDGLADAPIAALTEGAVVLAVPRREGRELPRLVAGFWCVPAVAHLVGSASGALRPDAFFRDLVAAGATIVSEPDDPRIEDRPGLEGPDAGRGAGPPRGDPRPRLA